MKCPVHLESDSSIRGFDIVAPHVICYEGLANGTYYFNLCRRFGPPTSLACSRTFSRYFTWVLRSNHPAEIFVLTTRPTEALLRYNAKRLKYSSGTLSEGHDSAKTFAPELRLLFFNGFIVTEGRWTTVNCSDPFQTCFLGRRFPCDTVRANCCSST